MGSHANLKALTYLPYARALTTCAVATSCLGDMPCCSCSEASAIPGSSSALRCEATQTGLGCGGVLQLLRRRLGICAASRRCWDSSLSILLSLHQQGLMCGSSTDPGTGP